MRQKHLLTPGGAVDITEIGRIPAVTKWVTGESANSVEAVGVEIKKFLDAKHGLSSVGIGDAADIATDRGVLQDMGLDFDPRATPFYSKVARKGDKGKPLTQLVMDLDYKLDPNTGEFSQVFNKKPVPSVTEFITQEEAQAIAHTYKRYREGLDPKRGLFSTHPVHDQVRAIIAHAGARANVKNAYRSLAEMAVHAGTGNAGNSVMGTRMQELDVAMQRVAKAVGLEWGNAKAGKTTLENLKAQLAQANPDFDIDNIRIKEWAVPESVIERLEGVQKIYSSPQAQEDMFSFFGQVGQVYRAMLLAYPSRHTRDAYSNAFQLWFLGKNPGDVLYGLRTARHIVAGNYDAAAELLKQLPEYRHMPLDAVKRKLVEDVASTGILENLASSDIGVANQVPQLNSLVPGSTPMRGMDFMKELTPDGSRNLGQMGQDYLTFADTKIPGVNATRPLETKNALLNASQKANDYVDSVSRLGGMLMLMRQGTDKFEAAKKVTEALVDYGSLTSIERGFLKKIFPWYSFQSRAGKWAANELLGNPGGAYAQSVRVFNRAQESDEETYIPEALRQQFALRVPDGVKEAFGFEPGDTTTFLRDIDILGYDTLALPSIKYSPSGMPNFTGSAKSTAYNLAQQLNPVAQSAIELVSGDDLFSRRPLEQANTSIDRIYKKAFNTDRNMSPLLRMGIELMPGPRIGGLLGGLADDRLPFDQRLAKQAINALTGVKLQDVDPRYAKSDARRMIQENMGGIMRDYNEAYVPKDKIPNLTPAELLQMRVFNTFGKQLQEMRKAKKEQVK
jgi:hypothetical protein